MFRKDYIMRMIEEFVKVLAKIVLLRETKNYTDSKNELDGLSRLVTGFGLEHLKSLGPEGINYVFAMNMNSHAEKIFCSAKMIKEDAMILEAENNLNEAEESYTLAEKLFTMASETDLDEKDEAEKEAAEIKDILKNKFKK